VLEKVPSVIQWSLAPFEKISFGYQVLESALVTWQDSSPQRFMQVHKIKGIFALVTKALAFVEAAKIAWVLEQKWKVWSFFILKNGNAGFATAMPMVCGASVLLVAAVISSKITNYFQPKKGLTISEIQNKPAIHVKWERPHSQDMYHLFSLCRILLNVSFAFVAVHPFLSLATAALQTYSLSKTFRWNWLRYDQRFEETHICRELKAITLSYFQLMLPASGHKSINCICYKKDPSTLVCTNHAMHDACIVGTIYGAMDQFNDISLNLWSKHLKLKKKVKWSKDGRLDRIEYSFNLSKEAIPPCPYCKTPMICGEIAISTVDHELPNKSTKAKVTLVQRL